MFSTYFEDKERGGLVHATSEDWSRTVNGDKHAEEQFTSARIQVIGAMISHDPGVLSDAERAVDQVMERFEDTENGGYFRVADKGWKIVSREKCLLETSEIVGVLMHLYEVNVRDEYLEKALSFIDTALDRAWDGEHGGFYSLYTEDWQRAVDTRDLATQAAMLQHLNGSWKDGMDSPYGARAFHHKKRAFELGNLLMEKAVDRAHGGFYTTFTPDWQPAVKEKEVSQVASLALTFYFHYHNLGPSIWGPRRGSHAFTGRGYPAVYTYRGPAPATDPVSTDAFRFGEKVVEISDLLTEQAWDPRHGGFYSTLTEDHRKKDTTKKTATQIACLLALNVAYRLTGFRRFQQRLAEAVMTIEERCFDKNNGGVYSSFTEDWTPAEREKVCNPNLMVGGILSMVQPVADGVDVTRQAIALWIDPPSQVVGRGGSARFTVTLQNQGFAKKRVRVGGLSAPSRWIEPSDAAFELSPHEVTSYTLTVTPPPGMPGGDYSLEITCMPEGDVGEYVSRAARVTIR